MLKNTYFKLTSANNKLSEYRFTITKNSCLTLHSTHFLATCRVNLIISFRASPGLFFVSFTKDTGFWSPCFSKSSDTLQ